MRKIPPDVRVSDLVGKDVAIGQDIIVPYIGIRPEILIPAGTRVKATGMGTALHLASGACPACGIAVHLRNVPRRYLALPGGNEDGWPAAAQWEEKPDGTCACTRCGFASCRGDSPERNALDADGKPRWRFCPGCGAGMSQSKEGGGSDG